MWYNRLMVYNWQLKDWPDFSYNSSAIEDLLLDAITKISLLTGGLNEVTEENKLETVIRVMISEALKSSAIEGENLSEEAVYSSVRNHFGIKPRVKVQDRSAEAISEIIVDAYKTYEEPLSKKQLNHWHSILCADAKSIVVGSYRKHKEAMQVISGYVGKTKVHFEAPPSSALANEMKNFITWFNATAPGKAQEIKAAPLRAAIAHLYFESIHPYEDGNGRLGRIIAEKALSQTMGFPIAISLSQEIEAKKKLYYQALEQAQKSNEITEWLVYFLNLLISAVETTQKILNFILSKSKFFERHQDQLNPRQVKVIKRMFEEGPGGFKGGMNASKYMKISKCSKATATRDLADLLTQKVFKKLEAGGRSTSYVLSL